GPSKPETAGCAAPRPLPPDTPAPAGAAGPGAPCARPPRPRAPGLPGVPVGGGPAPPARPEGSAFTCISRSLEPAFKALVMSQRYGCQARASRAFPFNVILA